ncbi:hypothetical protein [Brucella neotomae]|uniref:Uncharacterized protein n=1 Tax=Brucella neotomae 5K33 TaxID=520456 RepID=A0A7U8PWK3_BRUNE|nr:hypothetical protein [Brucella neotomae]EEY03611.1 conserved hypothetical protein [Brucella neotomae 5K33]KFJ56674.1 hypothetical protein DK64_1412 [Brucella neotomae 5K33]SPU69520.1 putative cytoplasmic protein [Brucella neotomae]SPU70873.1 putative cytoplasmic protein [Brucella neotomae]SUW38793.1 putative cytoplasmic protein [Brucella neotomae]
MQRYRFDDKRILTEAIVELLNQGIEPEDLDLDLMQECLIEVWNYNHPELAATQMAA